MIETLPFINCPICSEPLYYKEGTEFPYCEEHGDIDSSK